MCGCLSCASLLGTWPANQTCALTGNRTGDPLVHRPTLNPLSHTSRGLPFYVCLPIYLSVSHLSISLSIHLSFMILSIHPPYSSNHPSIIHLLSICPSIVCLSSIYLFTHPSTHPSFHPCLCISILHYLSIHVSINLVCIDLLSTYHLPLLHCPFYSNTTGCVIASHLSTSAAPFSARQKATSRYPPHHGIFAQP